MKTHLRWAMPLLAAPVIYFAAWWGSWVLNPAATDSGGSLLAALAALGLMLVALVGPVVALIFAAVGGSRVYRSWRRSKGRYTKAEAAQRAELQRWDAAWMRAADLRRRLIRREVPEGVQVWDVVASPGEVFFFDLAAEYSRFYGQNVTYSQSSGFYFGRPAFVLAGIGLTAMGNAARRSAAHQQAVAQWRENQVARVLVSNQRLLCAVAGRWLSFPFSAITAVYPEVGEWTLVLQFETAEPLMLRGKDVPLAALITTLMTQGPDALRSHPSLQRLGDVAADGPDRIDPGVHA